MGLTVVEDEMRLCDGRMWVGRRRNRWNTSSRSGLALRNAVLSPALPHPHIGDRTCTFPPSLLKICVNATWASKVNLQIRLIYTRNSFLIAALSRVEAGLDAPSNGEPNVFTLIQQTKGFFILAVIT